MKAIILSVLCMVSLAAVGQQDYLITLKKDTLVGSILISGGDIYDRVTIKTEEGKKVFKAFQVTSLSINGTIYDPVGYGNKHLIGQRIIKDQLSLYRIKSEGSFEFSEEIVGKQGEEFITVPTIGFKKRMTEYLADCLSLTTKINNKEFSRNDLEEIVQFYNATCVKNESKELTREVSNQNELINLAKILMEVNAKMGADEQVPKYLINSLKEYQKKDLNQLLSNFINEN